MLVMAYQNNSSSRSGLSKQLQLPKWLINRTPAPQVAHQKNSSSPSGWVKLDLHLDGLSPSLAVTLAEKEGETPLLVRRFVYHQ